MGEQQKVVFTAESLDGYSRKHISAQYVQKWKESYYLFFESEFIQMGRSFKTLSVNYILESWEMCINIFILMLYYYSIDFILFSHKFPKSGKNALTLANIKTFTSLLKHCFFFLI